MVYRLWLGFTSKVQVRVRVYRLGLWCTGQGLQVRVNSLKSLNCCKCTAETQHVSGRE